MFSERNRKVAIARWKKTSEKHAATIIKNSSRYPTLKARVVGYLMGDGAVTIRREGDNFHHSICFFPDDEWMLGSFLFAFNKIYEKVPAVKKVQGNYRVRTDSKSIVADLLSHGSFRSLDWLPPACFSKEQRIEWLRAFYDCEAYVGKTITVQSVNKKGLEIAREWLREQGIESNLYSYSRKNCKWNINYILHISRNQDKRKFLNRIGFNHSRKLVKATMLASLNLVS